MKYVFFSMRNFSRDGGGSVRMYGVMNALAEEGCEIVFISNAKNTNFFHPNIEHILIGVESTPSAKRAIQGLTALLPASIVYLLFRRLFYAIQEAIQKADTEEKIYFFEYLDNTIGYLLKKNGAISSYANDIHGVATLEFKNQWENATSTKQRLLYWLKYKLSYLHDKKVFGEADSILYASVAMKNYFIGLYPNISEERGCILPNAISFQSTQKQVNVKLKAEIRTEFSITDDDFVFFFAGGYKPTAGVEDLISAFKDLTKSYDYIKLLLIGGGPTKKTCEALVKGSDIEDKVIFINQVPYADLPTYQDLAKVIVCPDRDNDYSRLIVHLKYYDSLVSGKVVINGNFESVLELNKEEELSLGFTPSDVDSLRHTMSKSIEHYGGLSNKYASVKQYVVENLTYRNFIRDFHGQSTKHLGTS